MEYVKHRNRTKILGWVDFGMGIASFVFAIITIIILSLISTSYLAGSSLLQQLFDALENQTFSGVIWVCEYDWLLCVAHFNSTGTWTKDAIFGYLYLSYALDAVFCLVQVAAALFLIKSTSPIRAIKSSMRMTYAWFAVDILIILIYFIWRIVDGNWIMLPLGFLLRIIFLIFVWTYIRALKEASRLTGSGIIKSRQIKTFS